MPDYIAPPTTLPPGSVVWGYLRDSGGDAQEQSVPQASQGQTYLGILGQALQPEIADAMQLPEDQEGVLVVEVQPDSPAEAAGLQGSTETTTIKGQEVRIGGDVITVLNGQAVASVEELAELIQQAGAGEQVTLSVLRDGKSLEIEATLAERN